MRHAALVAFADAPPRLLRPSSNSIEACFVVAVESANRHALVMMAEVASALTEYGCTPLGSRHGGHPADRVCSPTGFDPKQYKVHFAVWNQIKHPIDVLATSQEEWQGWNSWRSVKDDFNRDFIFSVAQDKHDATLWLFGGIWEVLERRPEAAGAFVHGGAT